MEIAIINQDKIILLILKIFAKIVPNRDDYEKSYKE